MWHGFTSSRAYLKWAKSFTQTVGVFNIDGNLLIGSREPNIDCLEDATLTNRTDHLATNLSSRFSTMLTLQLTTRDGSRLGEPKHYPGGLLLGTSDSTAFLLVPEDNESPRYVTTTIDVRDFQ